jgi:hypothetical protein
MSDVEARAFLDGAVLSSGDAGQLSETRRRQYHHYDFDTAMEICDEIANGKTLKEICRDKGMPSSATVFRWMHNNLEFRAAYECAVGAYCDEQCSEMTRIADQSEGDIIAVDKDDGTAAVKVNKDAIERSRLRIETRQWIVEHRRFPSTFGKPKSRRSEEDGSLPDPENAKLVGPEQATRQDHPMYAAHEAWRRAIEAPK